MKRRTFLKGSAASLAGLASPGLHVQELRAASRAKMFDTSGMSLLLIHVDGLRADATGCYGNPVVKTPNLDRFATRATRFARCYCQSPTFNPSRSSFLTGLRPDTTGVMTDENPMEGALPAQAVLLPELLHQYGFRVVSIDSAFRQPTHAHQQVNAFDRIKDSEKPVPCEDACEVPPSGGSICADEQEPDGQQVRPAADILADMAKEDAPFFMSLGSSEPHVRLRCPKTCLDLYDLDCIPAPRAPACQDRDVPGVATRFGRDSDAFGADSESPITDKAAREAIRAYYACVSFMDAEIGTVLDVLDRTGLSNDTIVMIFSDSGFQLGEHGLWGKSSLFEQATRVPLLVRVPGVTIGEVVCNEIVELVDLVPTVCDLLTVPTPDRLEGKSFVPLLSDPLQPWKRAAFTVCAMAGHIGRSVRTKRWRYTDWQSCTTSLRQFELYDLDTDPCEQTNLALHPDHRNERTILANLLQRGWQAAQ
jgi:arylsulfatase A-like enzyme